MSLKIDIKIDKREEDTSSTKKHNKDRSKIDKKEKDSSNIKDYNKYNSDMDIRQLL